MLRRPRLTSLTLATLLACNGISTLGRGRDPHGKAGHSGVDEVGSGGASGESDVGVPSAARSGSSQDGASSNQGEGGHEQSSAGGTAGTRGGSAGASSGAAAGKPGHVMQSNACDDPPRLDGTPEVSAAGGVFVAVTGDWNGDGKLDVATMSRDATTISVFLGGGDGTLTRQSDYATRSDPESLDTGDIDGDGNMDLLWVDGTEPTAVRVMLGKGDGTFVSGTDIDAMGANSFSLGNFNADHVLDLVLGFFPNGVAVLLGNGDGTFGDPVVSASGDVGGGMPVDLNGDGADDLVATGNGWAVWLGNGDGTFEAKTTYPGGGDNAHLWVADVDGDETLDIVTETACAPIPEDGIYYLHGLGDGTFAPVMRIGDSCQNSNGSVGGDFNGDGHFDLLQPGGYVAFGTGAGTFDEQTYVSALSSGALSGTPLATADFDGDGKLDVVTGADDRVAIRLGNGDGTFGSTRSFSLPNLATGGSPVAIVLDENLGLFVANYTPPSVSLLMDFVSGPLRFATFPLGGNGLTNMIHADVNHDGRQDFVTIDVNGSTASVLLSTGPDGYTADSVLTTGDGPVAATLADVDGDHELDLVTANARDSTLSVRPGNANGRFGSRIDIDAGYSPDALALGDLNGDGKADAFVTHWGQNATVMLSNGDGTFTPGASYTNDGRPSLVTLTDLDRDGILDVAIAGYASVRVHRGNGDGTFGEVLAYPVRGLPATGLTSADMDGDGNLDLVIASDRLSVLFGKGDGTLGCRQEYATGDGLTSLSLGDVDHDGRLDVLALSSENVLLFVNPER